MFKVGLVSGRANCSQVIEEARDCYDVGVGYTYGDYLNYFNVDDPRTCQIRCQTYTGCTHFSFYTTNGECYMKTGNEEKRDNLEVVSGPGVCPSEEGSTTTPSTQAGRESLDYLAHNTSSSGQLFSARQSVSQGRRGQSSRSPV